MRNARRILLSTLLATSAALAGPPLPATPAAIDDLVYARPFRLEEGFRFRWSADRPVITEGWIVILDASPELLYPRETAEPVLYVGGHPAERINHAFPSGRVIALVPAPVDLLRAPIWFGAPELPERVDRAMALEEEARADAAGIAAPGDEVVAEARERGGTTLRLPDREALEAELAGLYQTYVRPLQPPPAATTP